MKCSTAEEIEVEYRYRTDSQASGFYDYEATLDAMVDKGWYIEYREGEIVRVVCPTCSLELGLREQ